jgi:hypothetical protein
MRKTCIRPSALAPSAIDRGAAVGPLLVERVMPAGPAGAGPAPVEPWAAEVLAMEIPDIPGMMDSIAAAVPASRIFASLGIMLAPFCVPVPSLLTLGIHPP